jgi:penicillin-insensitive murein endopeptidase
MRPSGRNRHELDSEGRLGDLVIDSVDLARLLCALVREAPSHGARVRRIILAPELQPPVAEAGDCPLGRRWIDGTPWVRHDEHVHVDFDVD